MRLLDASPQAQASQGFDVLVERPVRSSTSRMPRSAAKIYPLKGEFYAARGRLQCWKDLISEFEKDPWVLALKIVTKRLVTRRKTPGLDNPDRVEYIVRRLFSHVAPLQRQDRSSCVIRREELFTLEELERAGEGLRQIQRQIINGVPNEILKEVAEVSRISF